MTEVHARPPSSIRRPSSAAALAEAKRAERQRGALYARLIGQLGLQTVCDHAKCPNRMECYSQKTATFMILGDVCTRACRFCSVKKGRPAPPDPDEPRRVAEAARTLGLEHVVITCVSRDDLPDGGAEHFAQTIAAIRRAADKAAIADRADGKSRDRRSRRWKKPRSPIAPMKKPRSPIAPMKKPRSPIAPMKKPRSPIAPMKKPRSPIAPMKKPRSPIAPMKKPRSPIAPIKAAIADRADEKAAIADRADEKAAIADRAAGARGDSPDVRDWGERAEGSAEREMTHAVSLPLPSPLSPLLFSPTIEVLPSDFGGNVAAVDRLIRAAPDVYNHNTETVPRLFHAVRDQRTDYRWTLEMFRRIHRADPRIALKTGLMLGLGETTEELLDALADVLEAGCRRLTLGQYLQPSPAQMPVVRYVPPEEFDHLGELARRMGFEKVAAGPFVRSSYHAREMVCGGN